MMGISTIKQCVNVPAKRDSYIVFRFFFGFIMAFSVLRMYYYGWVETFYTQHQFYFKYLYFEWVSVPSINVINVVFLLMFVSSVCIAVGLFYRVNTLVFFITFLYSELWDKTYYLNHHYFVLCLSFLMIFIPLNDKWSLDNKLRISRCKMKKWHIYALLLQIGMVYFFAGVAKLKYSWLIEAMPMKIWLNSKSSLPYVGSLFTLGVVPYLFAWVGMLFDLTVPFFFLNKKTRLYAYVVVLFFHLMTFVLFNIGIFPFIMSGVVILFFDVKLPNKINQSVPAKVFRIQYGAVVVGCFLVLQLLIPLRHYLYHGDMLWTEQGYRFAWHVMLKEKNGDVKFRVVNNRTHHSFIVYPSDYLCATQEHQMSFQPDMIVEFAHFIKTQYEKDDISVYADTYVSLNGKRGKPIIDETKDLLLGYTLEEVIISP